jgi:hypothetical protein
LLGTVEGATMGEKQRLLAAKIGTFETCATGNSMLGWSSCGLTHDSIRGARYPASAIGSGLMKVKVWLACSGLIHVPTGYAYRRDG